MSGARGRRAARRPPAAAVLVVLVALCSALAVAGCGVPRATTERVEAAAILDARSPSTYLLDDQDALVAVPLERARQGSPTPGTPGGAAGAGAAPVGDEEVATLVRVLLQRLAAGPAAAQREVGLSTALGPGVPATLVEVVGGTARVALSQPDRDPTADRLPLAAGQVVLTVTSAPGVERVQLLRDGAPTAVPLPGGASSDGPVRALDYAALLAATG